MEILVQVFTLLFAGVAAVISFQNYRLAGRKRLAEVRLGWIENFRSHTANLLMELDKFDRVIDKDKIAYEVQYIDLMLDMRKEHHVNFKNAFMPLAISISTNSHGNLEGLFHRVGETSRVLIQIELDEIEDEMKLI